MKSIYVNQVGFFPESYKKAVLNFKASEFEVCNDKGESVFKGNIRHFGTDEISGEDTFVADF